ncbi:HEPN domain-containing protein [Janthinobacterium sp. BJB446]|uniref:HEPN domain-containing protein n=1 Tax=Janthinobacterium sp. BJB446 TaxID=2048009 RepID=UPI00117B624A|nr:HEPN domain-containing protein [Janthinobacterium sp. BJB446]
MAELVSFVAALREKYLSHHLAIANDFEKIDGNSSSSYDLDVRAYCVFVHAAIEQYFEELADFSLNCVLEQWRSGLPMSRESVVSIISIISFDGMAKLKIEDNEKNVQKKPLHYVSEVLNDSKKKLTTRFKDNHGASLKYLRALFTPLGMVVDPTANAESALSLLASSRGAFAHRRTMLTAGFYVYKPISPLDAVQMANDCLLFCNDLSAQIPYSNNVNSYTEEGLHISYQRARLARLIKDFALRK